MKIKTLAKNQLADFVAELKKEYSVYLPLSPKNDPDSSEIAFQKAVDKDISRANLDQPITMLPPSVFLLPLKEKLMEIEYNRYQMISPLEKKAVVGVKANDVRAINRLDKIFTQAEDKFYHQRRKQVLIVGINNGYQKNEFHHVFNPEKLAGFDIYLELQNGQYYVAAGSDQGQVFLNSKLLKDAEIPSDPKKTEANAQSAGLNIEKISWAIEKTKDSPIWDKWAEKCLGCGNCSYVCPMCFCYELKDEVNLKGKVSRCREQNSCFLKDFDQIAGSNPRKKFKQRFYHWYHHKFVQMPQEYGFAGCVNCGRCVKYCPAKINFREVLNEVIEEAENG